MLNIGIMAEIDGKFFKHNYHATRWMTVDKVIGNYVRGFLQTLRNTGYNGRKTEIYVDIVNADYCEDFLCFTLETEITLAAIMPPFGRKHHWMHADYGNVVFSIEDVMQEAHSGDRWIFDGGM